MLLDHIIIYVWNITVLNYSSLKYWPAVKVTDPDFADDLALITDSVAEAQDFLRSLELAANSVGLHLNEGKTKYTGIIT